MNKYLIAYDLHKAGQNYSGLIDALKRLGSSRHLQQSVWLIKTSKSAVEIRDSLSPYVDSNDSLFVSKITEWASWNVKEDITDWLKEASLVY